MSGLLMPVAAACSWLLLPAVAATLDVAARGQVLLPPVVTPGDKHYCRQWVDTHW